MPPLKPAMPEIRCVTPPRAIGGDMTEGVPTSFGEAIGIVRQFLELEDVPPKQLLLRAREELELPEQEGTMRQQLQSILREIGRDDVVFTRSPAVDPPSPPAALSATATACGQKPRPQTVLRQAVATAELQQHPEHQRASDAANAAAAALDEKKKLESLVQKMIVKHQNVLVERAVAQEARARAEGELTLLRESHREQEKMKASAVLLQQTVRSKEMEIDHLQNKIEKFVGAAKCELDKTQAQLAAKETASDLLQLRFAAQRATCVSALRARAGRALRVRCFYEWLRRTACSAASSTVNSLKRCKMEVPEARDSEVLCDKFRSLVSGTFVGHRANALFKQHDQDQDGRWSWVDFCRAIRSSAHVTDFAMRDDELRAVFHSLDDGIGLITFEQLQQLTAGSAHSSPHLSKQRRMKPPDKKFSVSMTRLRRAAADANERVRELEAAAGRHAVLTSTMRSWAVSAAATRRARVSCTVLANLRRGNAITMMFTAWARFCQWKRRAQRILSSRKVVRYHAVLRSVFTRWVAWRERLAMERLAAALNQSPSDGQINCHKLTKETRQAGDHITGNTHYKGSAVKARKQLQTRVEAAQRDAAESRRRADDLAEALKLMTVKFQKSEATVVELSDLVAFSHYGGEDAEPHVQIGSSARGRGKTPSSAVLAAKSKATTQPKRRTSLGRKAPTSNPRNIIVTLRTESSGQKLGVILDRRSSAPCSIAKVTSGGLADRAQIKPGYSLIAVQGQSVEDCKYPEAVSAIREAAASQRRTLELIVRAPHAEPGDDCTFSCGTRRAELQQKHTKSDDLKQNADRHQKLNCVSCPELPVQAIVDGVSSIGPRILPTSAGPRIENTELSLSPLPPVSAQAEQQPQEGVEAMDSDGPRSCSRECETASTDGSISLTLQMAEPDEIDSPPRSTSLRSRPATCWAEVVDPFSSLKARGPEICATSAKEALHFDDVRNSKTPSAVDSPDVSAVELQT